MEKTAVSESKRKVLKFFLSATGLLLAFIFIFVGVSKVLVHPKDDKGYSMIKNFYNEEENSLDAVFIGSSATYTNWNELVGWHNYGITAYNYASPAMPLCAAKYVCKEARKTQPNALYVINLVAIGQYFDGFPNGGYHFLVDFMPFSLNRLMIAKSFSEVMQYSAAESVELYIPLVRYHESWTDWNGRYYNMPPDNVKGATHYTGFLKERLDVTDLFNYTTEATEFKEEHKTLENVMTELLDYVKEDNVNVLFITTPMAGREKQLYNYINKAVEMATDAGYPVINMMEKETLDEIGIDLTRDFYNASHLNVHGSIKVTKYLSKYLIENYGFKDKRGDASYSAGESWDEAYKEYRKMLLPYCLAQELELSNTDNHFVCPKIMAEPQSDGKVELHWRAAKEADGYAIYRKDDQLAKYKKVAEGKLSDCKYTDKCEKGKTYTYAVIAYKNKGAEKIWSTYYGAGETVKL